MYINLYFPECRVFIIAPFVVKYWTKRTSHQWRDESVIHCPQTVGYEAALEAQTYSTDKLSPNTLSEQKQSTGQQHNEQPCVSDKQMLPLKQQEDWTCSHFRGCPGEDTQEIGDKDHCVPTEHPIHRRQGRERLDFHSKCFWCCLHSFAFYIISKSSNSNTTVFPRK